VTSRLGTGMSLTFFYGVAGGADTPAYREKRKEEGALYSKGLVHSRLHVAKSCFSQFASFRSLYSVHDILLFKRKATSE
jgi:hypothetical protein